MCSVAVRAESAFQHYLYNAFCAKTLDTRGMSVSVAFGPPSSFPDVYVFDFDKTILKIHAFALNVTASSVTAEKAEADCADPWFLRTFVDCILARGDAVCIASYGRKPVISAYISHGM
jgi:hypothetical protein